MNILFIYAHPNQKSFNQAILRAALDEAEAKGHVCSVRDLYASKFQPSLTDADFVAFNHGDTPPDIAAEQEAVKQADVVVFVHPIWWFGIPAILKGWIDRVFSYGFAYGHDSRGVKPLLAGKKAVIINTAGGAESSGYEETGFKDALIKLNDVGIFKFVGFDVILRRMFYQVPTATDEARRSMLELVKADFRKMF